MNPIETEDTAAHSLQMANGSLAALSMTLGSRKQIALLLRKSGRRKHAWPLDDDARPLVLHRWPDHRKCIDEVLAETPETGEGYARQFELLYDALVTGKELPVTLADARRSLELITAAYYSSRTNLSVDLPIGSVQRLRDVPEGQCRIR